MSVQEFNKIFAKNLMQYLSAYKMTQAELAEKLGVSTASVTYWCKAEKSPRMDKVDAMCKIFHCKRSDLMEEHDDDAAEKHYIDEETQKIAQQIFEDPDLHALFDAAKDAKPDDLQMVADMLKRFKETNPDG